MNFKTLTAVGLTAASLGVAQATTLDLTPGGSGSVNGALFTTTDNQSTGTGVIQSFVRVQDNGVADGYNATARPVMPDVNTSPTFTHDIQLSAIPTVTIAGTQYKEFLLDINQQAQDPLLSLDKIQIYTRATALTTANTLAALTAAPSVLRYDLDAGSDSKLLLNYILNSGSGSGDLFAYIPLSAFNGALGSDFLYLYSSFGDTGGVYAENDGFEEWAVRTPTTSVPDGGATVALLGVGLLGLGAMRRKMS